MDADANTLILLGDVPLVNVEACQKLIEQANNKLAILSFNKADPTGYGRIIRASQGNVIGIVEHKDATEAQRINYRSEYGHYGHAKRALNKMANATHQ